MGFSHWILHKAYSLQGILCIFLGGILLSAPPVRACDVPVFRYALERWHADPYEVIVFHRGVLTAEDRTLVDGLRHPLIPANILVRLADADAPMDEATRKLWDAQTASELPWAVVRYPATGPSGERVWAEGLRSLDVLDSPARREIARRILAGASAVWIMLESGRRERDDAVAELLSTQLMKMEEVLELPAPLSGAADEGRELDLPIRFSMLRVSRTDPRERLLVRMLLHSEWDLEFSSEPMAFPVFGRGRVLYALVGDGIDEDNIRQTCSFILGACSCEVKDLCPGTDLLMSADWEGMLARQVLLSEEAPPLVGLSEFAEIMEGAGRDGAAMKAEGGDSATGSGAGPSSPFGMLTRTMLILFGVGLVVLVIVSVVLKVRT